MMEQPQFSQLCMYYLHFHEIKFSYSDLLGMLFCILPASVCRYVKLMLLLFTSHCTVTVLLQIMLHILKIKCNKLNQFKILYS